MLSIIILNYLSTGEILTAIPPQAPENKSVKKFWSEVVVCRMSYVVLNSWIFSVSLPSINSQWYANKLLADLTTIRVNPFQLPTSTTHPSQSLQLYFWMPSFKTNGEWVKLYIICIYKYVYVYMYYIYYK